MADIRAEFETLMDQLCVPAFMIDVDDTGGFIFRGVNAHHTSVTGLESAALKGRNIYDVLPKRFADTISANYARCVESRAAYRYEEVLSFETGEIWWLTTLSPVFDGDRVVGIIGLAENITDYKNRQFDSLESVVEMKKLSEEISVFTGLAAHDLRGPLRQIRLVTELFEDGFVDYGDGKAELLTMIQDVADGALEKLDEVLQHARSFIGDTDNRSEIDFGHLCADLIAILDPMSRFDVSFPEIVIEAETVALQVELRNILDNALKHARSRVGIEVKPVADNHSMMEIRVSDDGPGFDDPEAALKLIQSGGHSEKTQGFGLGTVARLVASRGGELRIDSPVFSSGATICWTLKARIVAT
jgi:PAS domain S-box-containing protein